MNIPSKVYYTPGGTPYLKSPGVALISKPQTDLSPMQDMLEGFNDFLGFPQYLNDPDKLTDGEQIIKAAGQTCYASWSKARTYNKDAEKYINNLIDSNHGSVLEHANYSFLFYGISRSLSLELIRHRHLSPSQLSQRYVDGKVLRYVERVEFQDDEYLHKRFEERIDLLSIEYDEIARYLVEQYKDLDLSRTDKRKKANQAARACLPNETETIMFMTGNIRAWMHVINLRATEHAEPEIRGLACKVLEIFKTTEPILFSKYSFIELKDGTRGAVTTP